MGDACSGGEEALEQLRAAVRCCTVHRHRGALRPDCMQRRLQLCSGTHLSHAQRLPLDAVFGLAVRQYVVLVRLTGVGEGPSLGSPESDVVVHCVWRARAMEEVVVLARPACWVSSCAVAACGRLLDSWHSSDRRAAVWARVWDAARVVVLLLHCSTSATVRSAAADCPPW